MLIKEKIRDLETLGNEVDHLEHLIKQEDRFDMCEITKELPTFRMFLNGYIAALYDVANYEDDVEL